VPLLVFGLPTHALLVHAVVVLVPLAVLGAVVVAVWPAARRRVNGMGRIGRNVLRIAMSRPDTAFEVVAVNNLMAPAAVAHLLRHDSTYGPRARRVELAGEFLAVDDHPIRMVRESDPAGLPWRDLGVDVVIEATGRFRTREAAAGHLEAGARKVVLTAPGTDVDATLVMGINQDDYDALRHHIVSNASCTTNCAAPMAQVLDSAFGIEEGLLTTVHSYTADQNLLDGPHKDLRRGPVRRGQHHPDQHRRRQGGGDGVAAPGRAPRRHRRAGSGGRCLAGRPDGAAA
jgi:glyceraldehyde-3-phosphate dehydrogenase/erythrose-4-phosphate dehydrogenase